MADGARLAPPETAALIRDLPRGRWTGPLLVLGLLVLALLVMFRAEVMAALSVWENSTAYNHCWLVGPIAAWLAWQRRGRLAQLAPEPLPLAALLMLPGAFLWLAAERLGVMEGRQLVLIGMIWVAVLAVLGWRVTLAMAAPLLYLIFLVPFGEFLTPWLQRITAWQIEILLGMTDISFYIDDLVIEIAAGTFLVAEACAGLRFLIAAVAFGALYAFVIFRSPWRRALVMLLSVTVPIVANGFRAFGLVLLGHYQGSAAAVAADHVLYGWLFFSLVMLLLILAGLPFRQDAEDLSPVRFPSRGAAPRPVALAGAAVAAGVLAAAGPALAATLDDVPPPRLVAPRLAPVEGCAAGPAPGTLACQDLQIGVRLLAFSARSNWAPVAAERYRAYAGGDDVDFTFRVTQPEANWLVRHPNDSGRIVATAAWLAGEPAGDGLRSRARQALNSLGGGQGGAPVLAVVELTGATSGDRRARDLLRQVLEAQAAGLSAQGIALSRGEDGR